MDRIAKTQTSKFKRQAGVTLTEMLVVLVIIGLIGSIVIPRVFGAQQQAQSRTAKAQITALSNALEQYSLDMYDYPTQQQGLEALVTLPENAADGTTYRPGGYINKLALDPWGRPYVYDRPAQRSTRAFDLYSLGADGQRGGEGLDADIGNWDN